MWAMSACIAFQQACAKYIRQLKASSNNWAGHLVMLGVKK